MKKGLAILILLVSVSLVSSLSILPGEVLAEDSPDQYLDFSDFRDTLDDLTVDSEGKPPEDNEGDPDNMGDGLGYVESDDDCLGLTSYWDELLLLLMSLTMIAP